MTRRKQRSCHQCRTRHLKCDGQQPCGHCRRGVRHCTKEDGHIFLSESNLGIVRRKRRYSLSFNGEQQFLSTPNVTFAAESSASGSGSALRASESSTPSLPSSAFSPMISPPILSEREQSIFESGNYSYSPLQSQVNSDFNIPFSSNLTFPSTEPPSRVSVPAPASDLGFDYPTRPPARWPLYNYTEARLMRIFVNELAGWFDNCDGSTHFTHEIPSLASRCPALQYAILAAASKHESLMGRLDEAVSLRYQDACYKALLPVVQQTAFEATSLAAVLILRLVMEMTSYTEPDRPAHKFLGLEVFTDAWQAHPNSSVHAAIFMNTLRLYIHEAWTEKRALPKVELNCCLMLNVCPDPQDAQGRLWNANITMQVARTLNYAYGHLPKTVHRWTDLMNMLDDYEREKPKSLEPIFQEAAATSEGEAFPKIIFVNDAHACSYQYACMARLILMNHQPSELSSYDPMFRSQRQINEQSLRLLHDCCGLAYCHVMEYGTAAPRIRMRAVGLLLMSTMPIRNYGHLLRDNLSQRQAYTILMEARRHCAGLNADSVFARLRKAWGWEP